MRNSFQGREPRSVFTRKGCAASVRQQSCQRLPRCRARHEINSNRVSAAACAPSRGASLARYGAIHLLAENTLRGASVELSAISGQLRRRAQRILFEKVALPLFRRSQRDGQSRLFFFCFAVWDGKKQKSGIISQVLLYNREKLCYHNSARLSCAFPHLGRGGFTDPPLSVGRI